MLTIQLLLHGEQNSPTYLLTNAMSSTVDWADEVSSEFQTENYTSDVTTTSPEWTSMTSNSMTPYNAALAFIGYLGTVTNGLVLAGFWLSDRTKITSSSAHIINHTTLELSTFLCDDLD